jgi:hypothetical protein
VTATELAACMRVKQGVGVAWLWLGSYCVLALMNTDYFYIRCLLNSFLILSSFS